MTRALKNKIISIKLDCPIDRHWIGDPRFSKDGLEGIIYPIISRGIPSAEVILNAPLTNYQRNKLIRAFPKGCDVYWSYKGALKQI